MVEWKTIEDMGNYFGGLTGKTKDDFEDGNAKFITYMNVFANPSLNTSTVGFVRIDQGERQNKLQKGDILFTGSSETPEECGMSCVITENLEEDYYMNSFCFGLRLSEPGMYNLNYLKHAFRSGSIRKNIAKSASGVTRFNISKARFGKILIPIPSLSEQKRIVSILDTFTSSIANLKQQIEERRKQYEYERDRLLDLEGKEGVEMKTIDKVAKNFTGLTYKPSDVSENGTLVLRSSNIDENKLSFKDNVYVQMEIPQRAIVNAGDILICVRNGSKRLVGKSAMITKEAEGMAFGAFMTILRCFAINNKYLYHLWQSPKTKNQYKGDEAMPIAQITSKDFQRIVIPVPPLSEQSRIVSILDTFEASIKSLEEQLALREKQYEYYREKLLRFEEE